MIDAEHMEWHSLDPGSIFQKIGSSENGLDFVEAKKRLSQYGFNVLQTKTSDTIPRILLRQLQMNMIKHSHADISLQFRDRFCHEKTHGTRIDFDKDNQANAYDNRCLKRLPDQCTIHFILSKNIVSGKPGHIF